MDGNDTGTGEVHASSTTGSIADMLAGWVTAAEHGAAKAYHGLLAVEANVTKWEADNPAVKPFIDDGVNFASTILSAAGVPVPALISGGELVLSTLKKFAVLDSTVGSGTSNTD